MKIFFRFNCGGMWGLGHLYRNLLLIREMRQRGYECISVINDNLTAQNILNQECVKHYIVDEYDSSATIINIVGGECQGDAALIFWDRLDSQSSYITDILKAGIKIITYDNYDDSALLATENIVTRRVLVGGRCLKHAGPEYQLLSNDVKKYAFEEKRIEPHVKKILLHFGGTDPLNIHELCFRALNGLNNYTFEYILGKEDATNIKEKINKSHNSVFAQGVTDFARRLFEADLCLVSGGVTMYEAAAIGTPTITISHNEDQNFAASIFEKEVGSINLGIAKGLAADAIRSAVADIDAAYTKRREMSVRMKRFALADGVDKTCNIIEAVSEDIV